MGTSPPKSAADGRGVQHRGTSSASSISSNAANRDAGNTSRSAAANGLFAGTAISNSGSKGLLSTVLQPDEWEDARAEARAASQQANLIQDLNQGPNSQQQHSNNREPTSSEVWLSRDPERSRAVLALLKPTDTDSGQNSRMSNVVQGSAASAVSLAPRDRAEVVPSNKDASSSQKAAGQQGQKSKSVFKRLFSKCKW